MAKIKATRTGVKQHGDSWTCWWVLPRGTDYAEFIEQENLRACNGGPGQVYQRRPVVRYTKTRVLITQACGLDI